MLEPMTRPPRRWDPLRPLDLFTSVVSTAAVLPVSTGAAAAYRTALLTVRPLVIGRRITVRLATSDLALTVAEFDSRWDAGIFAVGHIGTVNINVGTTYEAVGEALSAGTADVGFIPGGTYVLYDDGCDVILTATRNGLSKDSSNAKDWNDGKATEASDKQAVSYRALFIAGPSAKGQELAAKVNAGTALTWDDLNGANWSIMGTSSPAGYIYPALWLQKNYSKGITDLSSAVQSDSYASAFARLASGQVDVLLTYADARRDYAQRWTSEFGRTASIWEETNVIGVTDAIYNDTICVSKTSATMDEGMVSALQQAFINIGNTDAGKEVIKIYSHNGYQKATSADYDNERAAQKLIQQLNAAK